MLYAKVVLGLPIDASFDYIVPRNLYKRIKIGVRVWVSFRTAKMLGYVVNLTPKTNIKNLKSILEVIDDSPILNKNVLLLTKELSDYYSCSWGEAIETALPEGLRKGKRLAQINNPQIFAQKSHNKEIVLIHNLNGTDRWNIYLQEIKEVLDNNKAVIILLPDIDSIMEAKETIKAKLNPSLVILYRKQPQELEEWLKVKRGEVNLVLGSRSAIFAPVNNLGLVIIDEEQDSVYKQEQVPHYNDREVAFMRINIEKAKLILGSSLPSLESFYLAKKNKIKYIFVPSIRDFPEIKVIDTKRDRLNFKQKNTILSEYLEDSIISCLNSNGKILLFLNRKGFATFASCHNCGFSLRCPRCNINLVYYFRDNILNCNYCNFKMPSIKICPNCNSGYIRYSGMGTEKIESELSRIFTQARIKRLDNQRHIDIGEADIFISTRSIIKQTSYTFDLIGVLSIDNSLNRIDFRASEKTFSLLIRLLRLTKKKMVIQTNLSNHYCFAALINKDINIFYDEELKQRRQLKFPPFKHLGLVKLRGEKESRVKKIGYVLLERLNRCNKNKTIKIISVNPAQPYKLRGKFYWQILIKANSAKIISLFLKTYLKNLSHSGIMVTVDIDPL